MTENSNTQPERSQRKADSRIAGEMGHDINKWLTVILNCSEKELARLPAGQRSGSSYEEIHGAAVRAASLTHWLSVEPKAINLDDPIIIMDGMLRRLLGDEIELVTALERSLDLVEIDPFQIEQVVWNLAVNAVDAMPNGGKLTIESANVRLDQDYVRQHPEASPSPHVMLSFTDTGCGMSKVVMDRIHEPFFTTKEDAKGSGMGLATCYEIIRQNGGHIEVSSQEGQGATFKVYLPSAGSSNLAAKPEDGPLSMPLVRQTVLLVDDEPLFRKITARTLRAVGYYVLEAADGIDAATVMAGSSEDIDLVLTDVVMPKMGGAELTQSLMRGDPNIPVLLMSGYFDGDTGVTGQRQQATSFLQKPFTPGDLTRKVREVLDVSARAHTADNQAGSSAL